MISGTVDIGKLWEIRMSKLGASIIEFIRAFDSSPLSWLLLSGEANIREEPGDDRPISRNV
jgi:hypothetical protein